MENKDWVGALQKFQPSSGTGAQSAGNPGMGAGSVPYAPGATQFQPQGPQTPPGAPQQGQQVQPPQGAGNVQPGAAQPPQNSPNMMGDPQRAIMIAEWLMARLERQMQLGDRARRG